jgi:hypothetical protein
MTKELMVKIESPIAKSDLSSTGWNLPENLSEADWKQAGAFLVQVDQARQWWLGDWWNSCKWGEGQSACVEIGVDYQTARNCGTVAGVFELSRRRDKLSFSHHAETCAIEDPAMQDKLLDWCLSGEKRKTVRELREKVQAFLAMKDWHESEKSRRFDAESGISVVANFQKDANLINWAKTEGLFVAIDRSTAWGNPFEIPGDGDRKTVCESYEVYFHLKKSLHKKLNTLKGKVLGCHCYPEKCHGDYLSRNANHES